jgi:hypothetical protein
VIAAMAGRGFRMGCMRSPVPPEGAEESVGWVSAFGCSGKAKSRGNIYQASQRVGSHFSHHSPSVRLHRDLADPELATDLLVQPASDDPRHDLPFAAAERGVAVAERLHLRLVAKCSLAAFDGIPDGAQQDLIAERLC